MATGLTVNIGNVTRTWKEKGYPYESSGFRKASLWPLITWLSMKNQRNKYPNIPCTLSSHGLFSVKNL